MPPTERYPGGASADNVKALGDWFRRTEEKQDDLVQMVRALSGELERLRPVGRASGEFTQAKTEWALAKVALDEKFSKYTEQLERLQHESRQRTAQNAKRFERLETAVATVLAAVHGLDSVASDLRKRIAWRGLLLFAGLAVVNALSSAFGPTVLHWLTGQK